MEIKAIIMPAYGLLYFKDVTVKLKTRKGELL
jgi:hypothetical protein